MYKSFYMSSSIPIRYRILTFKIEFKSSMRGWCLNKPRVTCRGRPHAVSMDALSIAVKMRKAKGGQGQALVARK